MKIVADEGVDRAIVARLRERGFLVLHVAEMQPGILSRLASRTSLTACRCNPDLMAGSAFELSRWGSKRHPNSGRHLR